MLRSILVLMLAAACSTQEIKPAEPIPVYVYEQDGAVAYLYAAPCADPASRKMITDALPQYAGRLQAIDSTWPERDGSRGRYAGCWVEISKEEAGAFGVGEAIVVVAFSDNTGAAIPRTAFKRGPGQGGT